MIRAVIFDLDDTLVKTHVVKWAQHKAVAKDFYDREISDDQLREHWGKPFDMLVAALHENVDTPENLRAAYASNAHRFPKEIHDDSIKTVQTLLDKGIKLGIVTATNKEFLLRDLKRLDFPFEQFFHLQAADETPYHKPDPRVFDPILKSLEEVGITKEETVYVGDALTDFQAARGAGLHFVAITTGLHSSDEFKAEGAPVIIDRIGEVPDALDKMTF